HRAPAHRGDVLGPALRHAGRPVRHAVDGELREAALVPRTRSSHGQAASPICELRVQKGHYKHRHASVLSQKFATLDSQEIRIVVPKGKPAAAMERSMAGRRLAPLVLSDEERSELKLLAARRKTGQALAQRARIVLACAEGNDNKDVATE